MPHYVNTEQISKKKDYIFKLPKYGKSTTDPTYYEPAATRIANMYKSAGAGTALYDFEYDKDKMKNWTPEQKEKYMLELHDKINITPGRKPGLTLEEISQNMKDTESKLINSIDDKKADKEAYKKQVEETKNLLNDISAKNDAENAKE